MRFLCVHIICRTEDTFHPRGLFKMRPESARAVIIAIMEDFAKDTGLYPPTSTPKRYLWTDAFAVCNFLELFRITGEAKYKDLAISLVDQVHYVLGRFSRDDPRNGWISGLDEDEGKKHPTIGGLRIGKPLLERGPDEPFDERLEWDRDGQYFHYLTKWMHALNRVSRVTGDLTYNRWAIDLAKTAHAAFTYVSPVDGKRRMYWKMSVDLTRPLVPSMGQHDPLDGYVTYNELEMCGPRDLMEEGEYPDLIDEIRDIAGICQGMDLVTDDPLGLGGLLFDSARVTQMIQSRYMEDVGLLVSLLNAASEGLRYFMGTGLLDLSAQYRLPFREFGLSIGLHGLKRIKDWIKEEDSKLRGYKGLDEVVAKLFGYYHLTEKIEGFWLDSDNQTVQTWMDHRDINSVMLATSLGPDGFVLI